ncbi:arylsulfatase [Singulisphaera sp. GP187]|uniref:arylsulfatase n=1 Tax=Singulisphaera sp. GP187 TaxID=1882752 RepID=UPI000928C054|nr:arylsulfatase [Singulisphaera sp. GP187]SIO29969.1 arylsulfatase [Singulisphaera sp. GP187]
MNIAHHAPPRDSQPWWLRLALFASVLLAGSPAVAADRPNIIVILADDLGYSDLGCFGGEIRTPNIDALAADGLRFTQFYNATRCCPSRASLLTGLYPHQAGVGSMTHDEGPQRPGYRGHLTERCVTIPEVLRSAGYRTSMVGKWHLGANPGPIRRGFDDFYGMIGGFNSFWQEDPFYTRLPAGRPKRTYPPGQFYSTDAFADYALDFLAESRRDSSRPWFLYLAFNAPHFPLHAPKAEVDRYASIYEKGWDAIREERLARMKRLGIVAADVPLTPRSDWDHPFHHKEGVNPAWETLPADRRVDLARRMAIYAAMVEHMDSAIGRVVASLKEHGQLDNTLILFLSDNGGCAEWDPLGFDVNTGPKTTNILHKGAEDLATMGGPDTYISYGSGWANASNTPWRLYKHYAHEGGISTPLVVHWPAGLKRKGEMDGRVGHIVDVMATCVDVSGARHPAGAERRDVLPLEGRSLVPALRGEPEPAPRTLFWEHEGHRAVRDGRWKLVARKGQAWELYDIEVDRSELHDLAAREPRRVARLATAWDEWAARCFVFRETAPSGAAKASPKPEGAGGTRP